MSARGEPDCELTDEPGTPARAPARPPTARAASQPPPHRLFFCHRASRHQSQSPTRAGDSGAARGQPRPLSTAKCYGIDNSAAWKDNCWVAICCDSFACKTKQALGRPRCKERLIAHKARQPRTLVPCEYCCVLLALRHQRTPAHALPVPRLELRMLLPRGFTCDLGASPSGAQRRREGRL